MRTEDVLTQINDAIGDWEIGPDAMRCNAPVETAPPRQQVRVVEDITPYEISIGRPPSWESQPIPTYPHRGMPCRSCDRPVRGVIHTANLNLTSVFAASEMASDMLSPTTALTPDYVEVFHCEACSQLLPV